METLAKHDDRKFPVTYVKIIFDHPHVILSFSGAEKPEIYFLGIIDVLTHYGVRKQAAYAAKTVKHGTGE